MRAIVNQSAKCERLDNPHIPHAGSAVVVYDIIRQNTLDVFFGLVKLSAFMNSRPEPSCLFSKWHVRGNPGVGYFEKQGMCEEFVKLFFDQI